jgi:hypothetical protein
MDTETSQAFAKVLEYITNSLGDFVDSNGTDVTEYIKSLGSEIVSYKLGIAYLWEAVAIVLAIIGITALVIGVVRSSGEYIFFGVIVTFAACVIAIANGYTIIECKTFPEKVIFDYIKSMYSNGSLK